VVAGLPPAGQPPHHHPRTTTPPTLREPPHGPHAPRGRPAPCGPPPREPATQSLLPSTTRESSSAPSHATPQEVAPVIAKRLLCPTNKNITYIK
jgi:hypothetical protein